MFVCLTLLLAVVRAAVRDRSDLLTENLLLRHQLAVLARPVLLRDRDAVYGGDFVARAKGLGIEAVLRPVRAPRANAIAERVVRTLRAECLDHVLVLDERHLERVLQEYLAYYNSARPHRSLGLVPPFPGPSPPRAAQGPPGRIVARPILGGLHHVYQRAA